MPLLSLTMLFPFVLIKKIWNDWFRDQDLETEASIDYSDAVGGDTTVQTLQNVAWDKDRFSTARPWPQKGDDVLIPMALSAPVVPNSTGVPELKTAADPTSRALNSGNTAFTLGLNGYSTSNSAVSWGDESGLETDLEDASGSIRALREAVAIQRFRDRMARSGSRYVDYLKNSFGVRSSDARLQRPELLAMGKQVIQFSEVLQTAEGTDPVGELRGHGIGTMRSAKYQKFFEEHGVVMTLFCVMPRPVYQNAQEKHWFRTTKEDFYDKDLALIGEEAILNAEFQSDNTTPAGVWGYNMRYYDYRDALSDVAGEFRDTLDFWHMARQFSGDQPLNANLISGDPTDRIFAVTSTDQLYVKAIHEIHARRPITRSSNPGIL